MSSTLKLTNISPTAATPVKTAQSSDSNNGTFGLLMSSIDLRFLHQPKGCLRAWEFAVCLAAFATMTDVSGIDDYTEFISLLVFTFIGFISAIVLAFPQFFAPFFQARFLWSSVQLVTLALDFFCMVCIGSAGIASTVRCSSTLYVSGVSQQISLCSSQTGDNVQASIALCFLATLCFGFSTYLAYREIMDEEDEPANDATTKV